MLLAFKTMHGLVSVTPRSLGIELSNAPTRRLGLRMNHFKPKTETIAASYCYRVAKEWDRLPASCTKSVTISSFKSAFRKDFN